MLRRFLALVAFGMITAPRRGVTIAESLAFENPEDADLRRWTIPIGRLEGIAYLLLLRRGPATPRPIPALFGVFAGLATVAPDQYLRFGLSIAYTNPDEIRVRSWMRPVTRVLGLVVLVGTVKAMLGSGGTTDAKSGVEIEA